jgi:hypothetical protein
MKVNRGVHSLLIVRLIQWSAYLQHILDPNRDEFVEAIFGHLLCGRGEQVSKLFLATPRHVSGLPT